MEEKTLDEYLEEHIRILCIDDELQVTNSLKRELRHLKWEIDFSNDPKEVLEWIKHQEYALIISDNMMPGLTGIELLGKVAGYSKDTRNILLTGNTDLNDAINAFNSKLIHFYMPKPWNKEKLLEQIHFQLEEYRSIKLKKLSFYADRELIAKGNKEIDLLKSELKQSETALELLKKTTVKRLVFDPWIQKLSFILIEPHQKISKLLEQFLRAAGVKELKTFSNASEAKTELLRNPGIDVLIMAWEGKEDESLKLLELSPMLKTKLKKPLFFATTTRGERDTVSFAVQKGIDGLLVKPFDLMTIYSRLDSTIKKFQPASHLNQVDFSAYHDMTFLIAGNDPEVNSEIMGCLTEKGISRIILVSDGNKAIRTITEKNIHVLLYDVSILDIQWNEFSDKLNEENSYLLKPALIWLSKKDKPLPGLDTVKSSLIALPMERGQILSIIQSGIESKKLEVMKLLDDLEFTGDLENE